MLKKGNMTVDLNEDDSRDIDIIFNEIGKEWHPKVLAFLMSQKKAIYHILMAGAGILTLLDYVLPCGLGAQNVTLI